MSTPIVKRSESDSERKYSILKEKQQRNACAVKTSIGGQALMEGIMMRGPKKAAMAVRDPKGNMVIEEVEVKAAKRPKFFKLPIIRGMFSFIDSMTMGYKCLMRSAEISALDELVEESPKKKKKREQIEAEMAAQMPASEEVAQTAVPTENEGEPTEDAPVAQAAEAKATATPTDEKVSDEEKVPAWVMTLMMIGSVIIAVGLAIGLFFWLPSFLYELLSKHVGFFNPQDVALKSLLKSAFEGIFKIILLVGYMALVSLMKEIRRTFMYHGAEHKTIFCYEAGLELTVENVRKQSRFHPRCGTSFLILMLIVSIFISFFIDPICLAIMQNTLPPLWRSLLKIALLPITMGIGYELIRFAGRHDNVITRIVSAPGMWLQHITVFEPTDDMIECAIAAVKEVIPEDGSDLM